MQASSMGPPIAPIQTYELVENLPKPVVFAPSLQKTVHLGGIYYVERGLCRSHRKLYESLRPYKCVALSRLRWSRITHYRICKSRLQFKSTNFHRRHLLQACKIHQSKSATADQSSQHGFHQANSCLFWCHRRMRRHCTRSSSQRWLQLLSTYANPCLNILTAMPNISMKSLAHLLSSANSLKNSTMYQPRR